MEHSEFKREATLNNPSDNLHKQIPTINTEFYECQIYDCNDVIHSTFYDFVNHINGHISAIVKLNQPMFSNDPLSFNCPWQSCEGICNLQNFPYHIFFHAHSCYLQNKGRKYIAELKEKNSQQQYQCPNTRPLITKNMLSISYGNQCMWLSPNSSEPDQPCSFTHPMRVAFYRHLEEHAKDDNVSNDVKMSRRCEFKCYWQGCKANPKTTLPKLIEHIRTHTKEKVIACPYCYSEYCNNAGFYNHLIRSNNCTTFTCQLCHKSKSSQRLLDQHLRVHISTIKCPHCEMTLVNKTNLKRHIQHRHSLPKEKLPCDFCDQKFKSNESLKNHINYKHFGAGRKYNSNSMNLYSCIKCQFICTTSARMTKHLKIEHNFKLPNGFSKFQYRQDERGVYQVVSERYEIVQLQ